MSEMRSGLPIIGFADEADFERWIEAQPPDATGLWVKFAKKESGVVSVSKAEAIDVALCQGWIDGQLDTYDDAFWLTRFTRRKPRSRWSQVNQTRALQLIAQGRMRSAGLAQVEAAKADGRWEAAYAPASTAEAPPDLMAALAENPQAAAFFATLKSANRYAILYRIGAVKKPETRARKIIDFVAMLERGQTIYD